jgi:hypothetical protein
MAHPIVEALAKGLEAPAVDNKFAAKTASALAYASDLPDVVMFIGFLGDPIEHPDGTKWQVLYLDLELTRCLLIEDEGVGARDSVRDDAVPFNQKRDVLWVKRDASVGFGSGPQSIEAQFLTGDFTRAADYEAPVGGGTMAASTGVFCEARTQTCCRYPSR